MKATYVISVLATLCQLAYSQDIRRGPHFIVPYGHPDAPLPLPVGTNRGASPVTPLVIGGEDKIWDLQPVGGGAEDRFTIGQGDRVVTCQESRCMLQPRSQAPMIFQVRRADGQRGAYVISIDSPVWPARAWSVQNMEPGTPVVISISEFPRPDQFFRVLPLR